MKVFETMTEALTDLKGRGYTEDFRLHADSLECVSKDRKFSAENFYVDEFYRFEGMTNPDDSSILFAISSSDGIKGTLVDAYGVYAENLTPEMSMRLQLRH